MGEEGQEGGGKEEAVIMVAKDTLLHRNIYPQYIQDC